MDLWRLTPIWFSVPIPLAVVVLSSWSTMRILARLDSVSVIDRGQLAMEPGGHRRSARPSRALRSSIKPLSSWTFYRRHVRQGLAVALTMALMIVGVAFPALLFAPSIDINNALLEHLRYTSIVSPRLGSAIDAGVMAQLQTHSTIARVVPAIELYISIAMEPLFRGSIDIYGVAEDDLQPLVESLGLQLAEGRLPLPRSNEIALTEAVALNRGLSVGDKVGRPVFEYDYGIPTEMVVAGILSNSQRKQQAKDIWLGFTSYEYLTSHEDYSSRPATILVVPVVGRKNQLDAWLEESVASERTRVETYDTWQKDRRDLVQMMLLVFGAVEGTVAIVAALALAILSYLFFNQRREEFGILHALGHSRRWLVRRTVGETVSVVAVAWLIGAAVCLAGLGYVWATVCSPRGLDLELLNPVPWLFTLPMLLAVVTIGAGLVSWMLAKLDPVSIIERRS
jgi:hypothetical protein